MPPGSTLVEMELDLPKLTPRTCPQITTRLPVAHWKSGFHPGQRHRQIRRCWYGL